MCQNRLPTKKLLQLGKTLVEGRDRRGLYDSPTQEDDEGEQCSGEPGVMMRLANGIEKAQEERLDVSAYATAPPQVDEKQRDKQHVFVCKNTRFSISKKFHEYGR